jgi:hypothetical protein
MLIFELSCEPVYDDGFNLGGCDAPAAVRLVWPPAPTLLGIGWL